MQFAGANEVVARARASVAVRGSPLNFKQKQIFFLYLYVIFFLNRQLSPRLNILSNKDTKVLTSVKELRTDRINQIWN